MTVTRTVNRSNLLETFREHLQHKSRAAREKIRQDELRDVLKDYVLAHGEEDESGSFWLDLAESVTVKVGKKVYEYTTLKAQRSLTPAQPTPQPEEAEALLRKKNLWLTEAQEKVIRDLAIAVPYAIISVDVDPDAVTGLLFKGLITDKEYEATLPEQTENFSFVPAETK
jgi:hypothetical protein